MERFPPPLWDSDRLKRASEGHCVSDHRGLMTLGSLFSSSCLARLSKEGKSYAWLFWTAWRHPGFTQSSFPRWRTKWLGPLPGCLLLLLFPQFLATRNLQGFWLERWTRLDSKHAIKNVWLWRWGFFGRIIVVMLLPTRGVCELVVCFIYIVFFLSQCTMWDAPPTHTSCWAFVCFWTQPWCCFCQGGCMSASSVVPWLLFSLRTSLGASDHQNQSYLHLISVCIKILTLADSRFLFVSSWKHTKKIGLSSCWRKWEEGYCQVDQEGKHIYIYKCKIEIYLFYLHHQTFRHKHLQTISVVFFEPWPGNWERKKDIWCF